MSTDAAYQDSTDPLQLSANTPNFAESQRILVQRLAPVLARLNELLFDANNLGLQTRIEIDQFEGNMAVHVNVIGLGTVAGRLLAQRRGLIR